MIATNMARIPPKEIGRLAENDPSKESADQTRPDQLQDGHSEGCPNGPQSAEHGQEAGVPDGKAKRLDWVEVMIWVFVGFCFAVFAVAGYLLLSAVG